MKIRKNTLATKLAGEATKKKEVKAKKVREKTVIVKERIFFLIKVLKD